MSVIFIRKHDSIFYSLYFIGKGRCSKCIRRTDSLWIRFCDIFNSSSQKFDECSCTDSEKLLCGEYKISKIICNREGSRFDQDETSCSMEDEGEL